MVCLSEALRSSQTCGLTRVNCPISICQCNTGSRQSWKDWKFAVDGKKKKTSWWHSVGVYLSQAFSCWSTTRWEPGWGDRQGLQPQLHIVEGPNQGRPRREYFNRDIGRILKAILKRISVACIFQFEVGQQTLATKPGGLLKRGEEALDGLGQVHHTASRGKHPHPPKRC